MSAHDDAAALIEALHTLESRDEAALATTFAEHASAYLGWP